MEEFRIQTSTYAPEFGRTPGGQISIVTRSGTNRFHGTMFDYFRNDILDANNWFNTSVTPPLAKAKERQNDFGGTLSGPIIRDRTFFFFSYEGLRLRLPQTALTSVPCDSTCTVFGNARTMAVAAMQPFLNAYPLPNGPELFTLCTPNVNGCPASGQRPTGIAQYNASFSNPATLDAYSVRADQRLSNRVNVFGRYNYSPSEIAQRGNGNSLSTVSHTRITTQTATVGATWTFSPTVTSDLRFNYSRTNAHGFNQLDSFGGATPLASLPLPSPFNAQNSAFFLGILSLKGGFLKDGEQGHNLQRQINIVGSTSINIKSHSVKAGVDFRRLSPQFEGVGGQYLLFPLIFTVPRAETGSFVVAQASFSTPTTFLLRNIGIYAEDTWRPMRRLTITYGLRWDLDLVPSSNPGFPAVVGFNLSDLSGLALAPAGTKAYSTTYGNLAPRVGVAYQLSESHDWQTVFRGGFGVFYDLASSELGNNIGTAFYPFGSINRTVGVRSPTVRLILPNG